MSERPEVPGQETTFTRAQSRAMSRCAPLTQDEFRARRRVAEQGVISIRRLVGNVRGASAGGKAQDR